jgi:2-C-methyl-D-erythritol 4-phosphate cytidylyltransferase/2-C-methyl-D-erythritol 2,4-cyclodiphosphate synthase
MKIAAVIAAGGTGSRLGKDIPKQFLELAGKPILLHTLEGILSLPDVRQVVIALPIKHIPPARKLLERQKWRMPINCIGGGPSRQESVQRGVARVKSEIDLILVHDAVRPLCDLATMQRVVDAAWERGGAVPALPATETIQRVSSRGRILQSPPREELYSIQTPQGFHAAILRSALARASKSGFKGTDESSVVRWAGYPVCVVPGSPDNIKITKPSDLRIAEILLSGSQRPASVPVSHHSVVRIGHGIDYHRLLEGRRLILGGLEVPFEKGLDGHSDADVLSHAICDAILGAAALGDLGRHFPDSDPAHHNRSSLEFLRDIRVQIDRAGWSIQNIDATLLAERPRLAPFIEAMRSNIAGALGITAGQISIKATTTEGMNAEGRGEGITAQAVALLQLTINH